MAAVTTTCRPISRADTHNLFMQRLVKGYKCMSDLGGWKVSVGGGRSTDLLNGGILG